MIFNVAVGAPSRPVGYFTFGGSTCRFDGQSEVNWNGCRYLPYGTFGWKMWFYNDGSSVHFDYINPNHDIYCSAVGPGGDITEWGNYYEQNDCYGCSGAPGGGGLATSSSKLSPNANVYFAINSSITTISGNMSLSAGKGGNGLLSIDTSSGAYTGARGNAGAGNGNGSGGVGAYNGTGLIAEGTAGCDGIYLFGDGSFDGVHYGASCGGRAMQDLTGTITAGGANSAYVGNRGSGAGWDAPNIWAGVIGSQVGIAALWYKG